MPASEEGYEHPDHGEMEWRSVDSDVVEDGWRCSLGRDSRRCRVRVVGWFGRRAMKLGEMVPRLIRIPRRICMYDGVAVRDLPIYKFNDVKDSHKKLLCETVRDIVQQGDSVVEVGSGRGLATVTAARAGAHVTTFEAAQRMVKLCRETVRINRVHESVDVRHGIVGPVYDAFGNVGNAERVDPTTIDADVLLLDCEGAELDIIGQAEFDIAIVETHPEFGAPTDATLDLLTGPEIVGEDPHDGHVVIGQ